MAERIVACVNACRHIPTELLEKIEQPEDWRLLNELTKKALGP
jgi:hypothetical protein